MLIIISSLLLAISFLTRVAVLAAPIPLNARALSLNDDALFSRTDNSPLSDNESAGHRRRTAASSPGTWTPGEGGRSGRSGGSGGSAEELSPDKAKSIESWIEGVNSAHSSGNQQSKSAAPSGHLIPKKRQHTEGAAGSSTTPATRSMPLHNSTSTSAAPASDHPSPKKRQHT